MAASRLSTHEFFEGAARLIRDLNRLVPTAVDVSGSRPALVAQTAAGTVELRVTPSMSAWKLTRTLRSGTATKRDYTVAGFDGKVGSQTAWSPVNLASYVAAEASRDCAVALAVLSRGAPLDRLPSGRDAGSGPAIRAELDEWYRRISHLLPQSAALDNEWLRVALTTAAPAQPDSG